MKANVGCNTIALLLLVACNRPETDLFGSSLGPDESGQDTGGTTSVAGANGTGAGMNGGTSTSPPDGGSTSIAGTAVDGGGSGGVTIPGAAGMADGAGGSMEPPQPTDPICGNGILEAGEECDDSAHVGDDGCDAACKVVCSDYGTDSVESDDHHCYNGYDEADFESAQAACVELGAHLASISSAAENKLARSLVNNSKWLGGFEDVAFTAEGVGDYQWITGEALSYTNWGEREPNGARVRCDGPSDKPCYEHCIAMLGDGTWADQRCDVVDGYVCEWEPAGSE
jgi:cysteine-rich repeat protein